MAGGRFRSRLGRMYWCALLVGPWLVAGRPSSADEPSGRAEQELERSDDFRVRVTAALVLARTRPPGALDALDHALGDAHSAVRVAAAEALALLGDPAAIPSLEQHLKGESSAAAKAQFRVTLAHLRAGVAAPEDEGTAPSTQHPGPAADVRYLVSIGKMRNKAGVRGEDLRLVFAASTRERAYGLRGVAVVVAGEGRPLGQAATRRLPTFTLDGTLAQLTEARVQGNVEVHARVEFTLRRDQTLRATLSGTATLSSRAVALTEESFRRLEDEAVDSAVQSALRRAADGLVVAARR